MLLQCANNFTERLGLNLLGYFVRIMRILPTALEKGI